MSDITNALNIAGKVLSFVLATGIFGAIIILIFKAGQFVSGAKITEKKVDTFSKQWGDLEKKLANNWTAFETKQANIWTAHEAQDLETRMTVKILTEKLDGLIEMNHEQNTKLDNLVQRVSKTEGCLEGVQLKAQ